MSTQRAAYKFTAGARRHLLVQRPKKQFDIGVRWLRCGWRLFLRNPWQLGGMGLVSAIITLLLYSIPLFGSAVTAFFGPIFLASAYLAADEVSSRKTRIPRSSRMRALMRSPRQLLSAFDNEDRFTPVLAASAYSMVVVVLLNILAHPFTNGVWLAENWVALGVDMLFANLGAVLLMLVLYLLVAASIVYALPLAFFRQEPLIPAMARSVRMSVSHVFSLLVVLSLVPGLYLLGVLAALWSVWAGYLVWLVMGTVVLPLVVTSAYCSYRTVFQSRDSRRQSV